MKLNVNYNELKKIAKLYLPDTSKYTVNIKFRTENMAVRDRCGPGTFKFISYGHNGDFAESYYSNFACVIDDCNTIYEMLNDSLKKFEDEYYEILNIIGDFRYYYEYLASTSKEYDGNKVNVKVKSSLEKGLKANNYKKVNKEYEKLIEIYGVKKAKSIVRKSAKKAKKNIKFIKSTSYEKTRFVWRSCWRGVVPKKSKKTSVKKVSRKKIKKG